MLRNARVIEHQKNSTGIVHIGTKVKLQDLASNEELVYTLVGSAEADPMNNKISNESPVGKAIMGKKTGDIVEVDVPIGKIKYKIMQVF